MVNKTNIMTRWAILVFFTVLVGATTVVSGGRGRIPPPKFFYVDAVHGNNNNEGLTPGTAFATIQRGIDAAVDGDTILVYPGLYSEEINFFGKALAVQGVAAEAAGIPVLHNPDDFAVSFYSGEGPDSILENFVIRDSFMAVFIARSSPTIRNVTIVDNTYGIEAYVRSEPDISDSIFWRNIGGDLFGCQVRYSRTSEASEGEGNITADPLFVDPNSGDYHLFSARGRYWPEHDVWVLDRVTSPCVDGGDPNADPSDEPMPNGDRINMGAYGGTVQASMSPGRPFGQAYNPSPADGSVDVSTNATLSWDIGFDTVLHRIYFGTENPPPFVTDQAAMEFRGRTWFDPGRINSDTVYYWRIDEVDSRGNTTAGAVWNFTTSSGPPPKGRACFVPETGVWVDGILVSISKTGIGRSISWAGGVGTKNSSLPQPCWGKVEDVQEHEGVFGLYDVLLESGNRIGVAERHYFLTESGNWIAVQDLKAGTRLQTPKGPVAIVNVAKRLMPYAGKVYNLKVEGSDRYLVGKDAIIVRDH
jgi:hypothetical protein